MNDSITQWIGHYTLVDFQFAVNGKQGILTVCRAGIVSGDGYKAFGLNFLEPHREESIPGQSQC